MTAVSLIDVLAEIRPHVDAEVLLVRLSGGAVLALTIRGILRHDETELRIDRDADGAMWVTLCSNGRWGPSRIVESLDTLTFAEFVGALTGSRSE